MAAKIGSRGNKRKIINGWTVNQTNQPTPESLSSNILICNLNTKKKKVRKPPEPNRKPPLLFCVILSRPLFYQRSSWTVRFGCEWMAYRRLKWISVLFSEPVVICLWPSWQPRKQTSVSRRWLFTAVTASTTYQHVVQALAQNPWTAPWTMWGESGAGVGTCSMSCQPEDAITWRRRWPRSLRDIISIQRSLISAPAYLVVIKIRN